MLTKEEIDQLRRAVRYAYVSAFALAGAQETDPLREGAMSILDALNKESAMLEFVTPGEIEILTRALIVARFVSGSPDTIAVVFVHDATQLVNMKVLASAILPPSDKANGDISTGEDPSLSVRRVLEEIAQALGWRADGAYGDSPPFAWEAALSQSMGEDIRKKKP